MMWIPVCGETGLDGRVTATDAFYVLRAAVGSVVCFACICDVDDSGGVTATDALRVLQYAVGLPVVMACPVCAPAVCGDGTVNRSVEECDGTDDNSCPGLCQPDCRCTAPSCGDGTVNRSVEECDGTDDNLCPGLCQTDCSCPAPSCGNGVGEQGELCDGSDVGNRTCIGLGFAGGSLACTSACNGFDTTACDFPSQLPPDPASIAPVVDPTVATDVKTVTGFLYSGSDPVQYGVLEETIDVRRAALIRGLVMDKSGIALSGVEIRVLFHPELGATQTRTDGAFDLVVNGGGPLTLTFKKTGYLAAQRQLDVAWQGTSVAPDVVLLQVDPVVTTIDLSSVAAVQVHQASLVSDAAGDRRATLMFSQGTGAELVMPDGTRRAVTSLDVRATEYTNDAVGTEAMPAALPPTSAYTYAFELSADEAIAAGAKDVAFDRPVVFYVDNFLQGAVGMTVPVGYYDRGTGQWKPSKSGVIVEIVSITSGMADLDTDGDGVADAQATLDTLGITNAERTELANLHVAGESLWRIEVAHFSAWDANWGWGPPGDATYPDQDDPEDDDRPDDPCEDEGGSVLECESQVLGEELPVAGTEFTLNYRSSRVPGRKAANTLHIPLTGASVPASLTSVEVEIQVAGGKATYSVGRDHPCLHQAPLLGIGSIGGLTASRAGQLIAGVANGRAATTVTDITNQSYDFTWDGKDAYGRTLQGKQPVTVKIGFTYCGSYQSTTRFGYNGGGNIAGSRTRRQVTMWRTWNGAIGPWDARGQGLGGWTIDAHHAYDPVGKVLYLGDGRQRSAEAMPTIINTVAGGGSCPQGSQYCGSGCPCQGVATDSYLSDPNTMAVGPDGTIYVTMLAAHLPMLGRQIVAIRNGLVTRIAGLPGYGYGGDGGPALFARFGGPIPALAVGPDGSLYVLDQANFRIRKIGTDGIITTVAGNGQSGVASGDGGPATQATLSAARIAVGPDGSLYIGEPYRVRRVAPDGTIDTFAGNGIEGDGPDGVPADQSSIASVQGLVVAPDGSLYIATGNTTAGPGRLGGVIRRVRPDGTITTIARDSGGYHLGDDGIPAMDVMFVPSGIGVFPNGDVVLHDGNLRRVLKIDQQGILTRLAGRIVWNWPWNGFEGDGGPATNALFSGLADLAVSPDGALYVLDAGNHRVRRIGAPLPGVSLASEIALPSEDGSQLYVFDRSGRHLQTRHALTGATLYSFTYDTRGLLTTTIDGYGNRTTVERDGLGNPTGILGPFGQRTVLATDASSRLASLTNPAGNQVAMTYTADGLLSGLTDPRGNPYLYSYDSEGRLIRDDDPAGGYQTLTRTDLANGFEVAKATALGRTTTYRYEKLTDGSRRRTSVLPDGTSVVVAIAGDGTQQATLPDGTVVVTKQAADPRLGALAPMPTETTVGTPMGRTLTIKKTRTATLSDPGDVFSVTTVTDTTDVNGKVYTSSYDAATKTITETTPEGRQTVTVVDGQGRVLEYQLGSFERSYLSYDTVGSIVQATRGTGVDARVVTYTYDASGRLGAVTDPLSRVRSFLYDAADHITGIGLPGGGQVGYGHDAAGNLTSLTPPGSVPHGFTYTILNQESAYVPPAVGSGNRTTGYAYDLDRQLSGISRPDATAVGFVYDPARRPTAVTLGRGSLLYGYDPAGRLATATAPDGGTVTYSYDGTLVTGVAWTGTVSGDVAAVYDNDLHLVSVSVNGATPIGYTYDNDGLVTGAGALSIAHDAATGVVTGTALGGITTVQTHNGFAETDRLTASFSATPIYDVQFAGDALGRINSKTESVEGSSIVYDYVYDTDGRLTQVREDGVTTASYAYDANGNRTSATDQSGTRAAGYDAQDRLVSLGSNTYTYSAAGELLTKTVSGQITSYTYDELGDLLTVGLPDGRTVEYLIDGEGRRIGKKIDSTLVAGFLYAEQISPVVELDGNGTVVGRFIYGTRDTVPDYMEKGGSIYRLITDHLGSVRLVVDASTGQIAQRLDYDAFGRVLRDTNPGFQPFGFAAGFYDPDTGLVRFGSRDYDAEVGRWTAKDPIRFEGGDANLYAYLLGDPMNGTDPSGLKPGDKYSSERAAARDAIDGINPTSKKQNWEYAGKICKKGKDYMATRPRKTPRRTGGLFGGNCPKGWSETGAYHTHAGKNYPKANRFSRGCKTCDLDQARKCDRNFYVGTPDDSFWSYTKKRGRWKEQKHAPLGKPKLTPWEQHIQRVIHSNVNGWF